MFYEDILREFQKQRVKYVVVGGVAVNLHGYPRATMDLDILVDMKDKNIEKIVRILTKKGYHVKQPVNPMGLANKKVRDGWIKTKHMRAFNFYRGSYPEMEEVDIIIKSPVSYEVAKKTSLLIAFGKTRIPIISINNLSRMKSGTGRPEDKLDIIRLRKIKSLRRQK